MLLVLRAEGNGSNVFAGMDRWVVELAQDPRFSTAIVQAF